MHARTADEGGDDPLEVFFDLATLIVEARVPEAAPEGSSGRGYGEGPHCLPYAYRGVAGSSGLGHLCSPDRLHCQRFASLRKHAFLLWQNAVPLCIEVLVGPECSHGKRRAKQAEITTTADPDYLLLERWTVSCTLRKDAETSIAGICLVQAVRSFLHFSQLSAWLNKSNGTQPQHLLYRVTMPGQAFVSKFTHNPVQHHFPTACVGRLRTHVIKVAVSSLPRTDVIPHVACAKCHLKLKLKKSDNCPAVQQQQRKVVGPILEDRLEQSSPATSPIRCSARNNGGGGGPRTWNGAIVDDRMRIDCNQPGKHDCSCDDSCVMDGVCRNRIADRQSSSSCCSRRLQQNARKPLAPTNKRRPIDKQTNQLWSQSDCGGGGGRRRPEHGDRWGHDLEKDRTRSRAGSGDSIAEDLVAPVAQVRGRRSRKDCFVTCGVRDKVEVAACDANKVTDKVSAEQPAAPEPCAKTTTATADLPAAVASQRTVPSVDDQLRFQRSLDSAAELVFHTATSVHSGGATAQRFPLKFLRSPPLRMTTSRLLGSFEECLLNGRLEPMSTVEGFRAELGASGSFCPSHELLPVSVFFYNFGGLESDKTVSPYLAHLNLGDKGYQVPRRGTIQLTLFNPQGTVVKMFVVLFDLEEMPPNCKTFLRQRTYFMPARQTDMSPSSARWLRYLIHLRFCSSKSGRIYLHTDIRIIVLRKSDVDTASAHIAENSYEWKSFTRGPSSPRFSTR